MSWAMLVARLGEKKTAYRVLVENSKQRKDFKDLGVDRTIMLKWMLKKQDGKS
jgi:hypothetical protein